MASDDPLIFKRPVWVYLSCGLFLLLTGVPLILVAALDESPSDHPAAGPTFFFFGVVCLLGGVAFLGFRCRTIINFVHRQVVYEWATFFVSRRAVYRLDDVQHVGVRATSNPSGRLHHVFLATVNEGQPVRIELEAIVYHSDAVEQGNAVARALGKPFVDQTSSK